MPDLRWRTGAIHAVTLECLLPTKAAIANSCKQFANQKLQHLDGFTYCRPQYVPVGVLNEFHARSGRFRSNRIEVLTYGNLSYRLITTRNRVLQGSWYGHDHLNGIALGFRAMIIFSVEKI